MIYYQVNSQPNIKVIYLFHTFSDKTKKFATLEIIKDNISRNNNAVVIGKSVPTQISIGRQAVTAILLRLPSVFAVLITEHDFWRIIIESVVRIYKNTMHIIPVNPRNIEINGPTVKWNRIIIVNETTTPVISTP